MQLNPYGGEVVDLAAALANQRPTSTDELADRCREAGLILETPVVARDVQRVNAALDDWERVVDAADQHERARLVNQMIEQAAAYPRLTDHGGTAGWHLHYRADGQPLGAVLHVLFAVGTALHLANRGMHRLRRCEVDECTTIFADTSRTGRQRYCSVRCANRDAVRRHRARASAQ